MRIRGIAILAATALGALTVGACTSVPRGANPDPTPASQSEAAATTAPAPAGPGTTGADKATPAAPPPQAGQPTQAAGPESTAPPPGQQLDLAPGETAHLTYFDVTFQRFAHGEDGISAGWRVEVCYRRPHPQQNPDGTTRVSSDPWSVQALDAEGPDGRPTWVAINDFTRDNEWTPPYPTTQLRLGACQEGWLGVRHGNPDLQFLAVRYAPADFGDVVIWRTAG